ncbi:MAG: hypothetical protein HFJ98_08355 [Eubacterium sp.]|nr:hypothetical protein [Eubacterium sp.]
MCIFGNTLTVDFLWNICVELSENKNDFEYNVSQIYIAILDIKEFNEYYTEIANTLADKIRKEGY